MRAGGFATSVLLLLLVLLQREGAPAAPQDDATPATAESILSCAFGKRFDRELSQIIDVRTTKDGRTIRSFRLQMATKVVDDRYRSLVYFLAPFDERGIRVLTIENEARSDEHFVFLPFLERIKRIQGGRRQESFMGTDFAYEDMERMRTAELDAELRPPEELDGEPVYVVAARPRHSSRYTRSEYRIAESDCSLLEVRHFKEGQATPVKIVSVPRAGMVPVDGELMPTRAIARDLEARRQTELRFSATRLDHGIGDGYFEPSALLRMNGIPGVPKAAPDR